MGPRAARGDLCGIVYPPGAGRDARATRTRLEGLPRPSASATKKKILPWRDITPHALQGFSRYSCLAAPVGEVTPTRRRPDASDPSHSGRAWRPATAYPCPHVPPGPGRTDAAPGRPLHALAARVLRTRDRPRERV